MRARFLPRLLAALTATTAVLLAVGMPTTSAAAQDGDPEQGREVFQRHCSMCHGDDAGGMAGMHPSLHGATDRLTPDGVEIAIRNGRDVTPPMPAFEDRLSDHEIADIVAYVASLPNGPRNPDGDGMGDMNGMDGMGDMMNAPGDGDTVLWVVIVIMTAVAAGLGGYLLARRRSP